MIKTILTVVVIVVVLNGLYRTGRVAWDYFQLKDAAEQAITFGGRTPTDQLHQQIMAKAAGLQIPLEPQDLDVRREANRTIVSGSYQQPLEYFPNAIYPMNLSFTVEAFQLEGVGN